MTETLCGIDSLRFHRGGKLFYCSVAQSVWTDTMCSKENRVKNFVLGPVSKITKLYCLLARSLFAR